MFSVIGGFTDQQLEHGKQHLFAQIRAIEIGKRLVLTSEVAEEDDDLHENGPNVERRCNENVLGEPVLGTQESVLCEPATNDGGVTNVWADGFEPETEKHILESKVYENLVGDMWK